ncbi:MAG TPA: DUF6600 domain-containing protein [Thermoanaerobaculia bacterium]|nr:DUF6600 domain-containing protein [Thermoanaerobaculia bacterium]
MSRKVTQFALLLCVMSLAPLYADGRNQSYISYDDGDSVLLQNDGKEVDTRLNMPVYPGDQLRTNRRGRTEIRLSDGNVLAVDRGSEVRFHSMYDSYEGDASQTVVELQSGTIMLRRLRRESNPVRVDSGVASYVSARNAVYEVETDLRGADLLSVYEGSVEVRTQNDSARVRSGEKARVDGDGLFSTVDLARDGTTDFERWFLNRNSTYGATRARYLDGDLAYAEGDLDANGSWKYVSDYGGWVWRPTVSAGWRPYYYGSWRWGGAGATWVSDEAWGWVPYHYGRWAYSGPYGWVWIPGSGYSPAWVYWVYGPSYLGWVPAGYYDCFRPYYDWLYRPYYRAGFDIGSGFYGRVRLTSYDYNAWTFVDSRTVFSNRADRAALTADAVRGRLARDGGQATISNVPFRVRTDEIPNPAIAVGRIIRGVGGSGTGRDSSGLPMDMTSFFHRDPALSAEVRTRLSRGRTPSAPPAAGGSASIPSSRPGDDTRSPRVGATDGVVRGRSAGEVPARGGADVVRRGGDSTSGAISRPSAPQPRTGGDVDHNNPRPAAGDEWRGRVIGRTRDRSEEAPSTPAVEDRGRTIRRDGDEPAASAPGGDHVWRGRSVDRSTPAEAPPADSWRNRGAVRTGDDDTSAVTPHGRGDATPRARAPESDDVPQRVIGRIVAPRPSSPSSTSGSASRSGSSSSGSHPSHESTPRSSGGEGRVSRPESHSTSSHSSSESSEHSKPKKD